MLKSKLLPGSGSAAFRQINPSLERGHKQGRIQHFILECVVAGVCVCVCVCVGGWGAGAESLLSNLNFPEF